MQKFAMWWHMYRYVSIHCRNRPNWSMVTQATVGPNLKHQYLWSCFLGQVIRGAASCRHRKATCSWHFVPRFPLRPRRDTRHSLRRRTCPGQRWGPDLRASFRMLMGQLLTAVFLSDLYQFVNVERLYDVCMYGYVWPYGRPIHLFDPLGMSHLSHVYHTHRCAMILVNGHLQYLGCPRTSNLQNQWFIIFLIIIKNY